MQAETMAKRDRLMRIFEVLPTDDRDKLLSKAECLLAESVPDATITEFEALIQRFKTLTTNEQIHVIEILRAEA